MLHTLLTWQFNYIIENIVTQCTIYEKCDIYHKGFSKVMCYEKKLVLFGYKVLSFQIDDLD